jgi:hypothetical protein
MSTYCAEFVAETAVEEAISTRYMLCCLGVPVTTPTVTCLATILALFQSAEIPDGELKKEHICIIITSERPLQQHESLRRIGADLTKTLRMC